MSGPVANNIFRSSGVVAAAAGGLLWSPTVITGSTATVEAGNGYWINTTSNACTITLPSSAEKGDQIIFVDFARTWGTNNVTLDQGSLKFQGSTAINPVYSISGQNVNIVYSDSTNGWVPLEDDAVAFSNIPPPTQRGIIAFGEINGAPWYTNNRILINSSGVLASSTSGVGTIKGGIAGAGYGYDKGICSGGSGASTTNLVNNQGVVAANVTGVGTDRNRMCGTTYGGDKGFFGFGNGGGSPNTNITNLVSNLGVVASDVSGIGTARVAPGAATYGSTGQALAAFGGTGSGGYLNVRNLISNQGVMASDISGAGTTQDKHLATRYGTDTSIFVYGQNGTNSDLSTANKVSNTGVISADITGVGTGAYGKTASSFGGDKGIFYGGRNETTATFLTESNIVSNTGVVASSVANSGNTSVLGAAGMGYSTSA